MKKIMMVLNYGRACLCSPKQTNSVRSRTIAAVAAICFALSGTMLTSCDKIDEMEGMNDSRAYYSYQAQSNDFDYQDAAGPFNTAIRNAVGMEPIMGGNDSKVIEACNVCYESLKQRLSGRSGKVLIYKIRHPGGMQKKLKVYKF